jgi:2-amino-4-hydroxy-6-hydroxymethyldihydropteridine diphosphokinase
MDSLAHCERGCTHIYAVAIGSNQPHPLHGSPDAMIKAAHQAIHALPDCRAIAQAKIYRTAPIGPSQRRYSNSAVLVETSLPPPAMLARLQSLEQDFGRKRRGQRWRARVIDLDIALWSGGIWRDATLAIPHRALMQRDFVLRPLCDIARTWPVQCGALMVQHAFAQLHKGRAK